MNPEAGLWKELRRAILMAYPNSDLVRIENVLTSGTPDVNGCVEGTDFWCELKVIALLPPRNGPVRIPHYTQDQRLWIRRRGLAGGRVGLLLQVNYPRHYLVFHWPASYQDVGRVPFARLCERASMVTPKLHAPTLMAAILLPATRMELG